MAETIAGLAKTLNDLYDELGRWDLVGKLERALKGVLD